MLSLVTTFWKWTCTACGTSHFNYHRPADCPNPDCKPLARGYRMEAPTKEEAKNAPNRSNL